MPFIKPKVKQESKREKRSMPSLSPIEKQELFEKFMIEIGQWKRVDGNIVVSGSYMSAGDIKSRYSDWLSKSI